VFPAQFDYQRAHSIDEALSALASHGDDARILAGGQSLIPAMRFRLARPAVLIDINPIEELAYLRETDGFLCVGAGTRDFALEVSPLIASRYPLIADTSALVADPVVRQMGTVVGSLCHNDPAGDWPVAALAARAQLVLRSKSGTRTVAIDDFLVDSYTTAVKDGEMAVSKYASRRLTTARAVRITKSSARSAILQRHRPRRVDARRRWNDRRRRHRNRRGWSKALRVSAAEKLLAGAKPSKDVIAAARARRRRRRPVSRQPRLGRNTRRPWPACWLSARLRPRSNALA
jgi:carbon-monoxide dehydrogenase medium subunit